MASLEFERWICTECDKPCIRTDMLMADNPFVAGQKILGCPSCYAIDSFTLGCDVEGCNSASVAGWQDAGGRYRRTCSRHTLIPSSQ